MKTKVCAGGFLMDNDKFLFGKRSAGKSWAPGVWDIVGGHAKKHEDIFDALKRETMEEAGIVVKKAELLTSLQVMDTTQHAPFIYFIYFITEWEGEAINCSGEHTEIRWFTRSELETIPIALPGYLALIDDWMLQVKK